MVTASRGRHHIKRNFCFFKKFKGMVEEEKMQSGQGHHEEPFPEFAFTPAVPENQQQRSVEPHLEQPGEIEQPQAAEFPEAVQPEAVQPEAVQQPELMGPAAERTADPDRETTDRPETVAHPDRDFLPF